VPLSFFPMVPGSIFIGLLSIVSGSRDDGSGDDVADGVGDGFGDGVGDDVGDGGCGGSDDASGPSLPVLGVGAMAGTLTSG